MLKYLVAPTKAEEGKGELDFVTPSRLSPWLSARSATAAPLRIVVAAGVLSSALKLVRPRQLAWYGRWT